ncbi:methyltransferase domain-containing protein [Burkholderia sp. PU8-34]
MTAEPESAFPWFNFPTTFNFLSVQQRLSDCFVNGNLDGYNVTAAPPTHSRYSGYPMTSPQQLSQLGDFSRVDAVDANDFVTRLDVMQRLDTFQIYKQETFELMGLRPGMRIADVGCGTGDDLGKLVRQVAPGGSAMGFDLSEAMLDESRRRFAAVPALTFRNAPATALGVAANTFDAIRADRVLIHVPTPENALMEMIRVTRPGGRIVVSEPDMPGCWVASSDYALTGRIMQSIAESCVNPYLARDLFAMFRDAGLDDISFRMRSVTAFDPRSVDKILDFKSVIATMQVQGLFSEEEVAHWLAEFEERGRTGRFVAGLPIMIVTGTKPE